MSECYELNDGTFSVNYTEGDKFIFTADFDLAYCDATKDELIGVYELVLDDGSSCPKFRSEVSGRTYYESWELFSKYVPEQTTAETEPTELEEAHAKIESLESALEDAVREIFSLKHQLIAQAANTCLGIVQEDSEQFKPISEYTLEDWELAIDNNWEFELRSGEVSVVDEFYPDEATYVVSLNKSTQTITGKVFEWNEEHENDVVKRIK